MARVKEYDTPLAVQADEKLTEVEFTKVLQGELTAALRKVAGLAAPVVAATEATGEPAKEGPVLCLTLGYQVVLLQHTCASNSIVF